MLARKSVPRLQLKIPISDRQILNFDDFHGRSGSLSCLENGWLKELSRTLTVAVASQLY
jgi:hypothetical protein